jgi:hypothetical protein
LVVVVVVGVLRASHRAEGVGTGASDRALLLLQAGGPAPLAGAPGLARARAMVHTELLRFMRPRKVDRLCRPVDTELMAERCVPLQRQRCEGVSL